MRECKCTMSQRLTGDGCEVCNPALALEYAKQTIEDLQADRTEARKNAARYAECLKKCAIELDYLIDQTGAKEGGSVYSAYLEARELLKELDNKK